MEQIQKVKLFGTIIGITAFITAGLMLSTPAHAQSTNGIQAYSADSAIDKGTIVQLVDNDPNKIKVATGSTPKNVLGVVIDGSNLPFKFANEARENETYVAVSGTYNVLVSNQGGAIEAGDYVALSAINGVAMKAGTDDKTVFGRATASFDGSGVTLGTSSLKDTDGKSSKSVALGSIPVTIDIRNNPNDKSTKANVPEALERIGEAIAEKEVSPIRIYLSMAITAISIIATIVVLYSGVRNGMISIGRNPMSKKSIFRALLEIILTSILTLIIGLFAVYLLLKL